MLKAEVKYSTDYVVDQVDERLYGSFVEHMGRVVYTGIYEPEHTEADEEGFRKDVISAVKDMNVTTIRYPGGNFVSCYDWKDAVGPKKDRPRKIDLAWRSIETNQFGIDEFIHWCKKTGVEPIFTVNLGTKGIEDAVQFLEYCNFPKGTQYSEMRRSYGIEEPYGIKTWCLGNEMDGEWQIGHKTADEYGRLAAETGKAMKIVDETIELIACGSSLSEMQSCPDWDMAVLNHVYGIADYIALHQYYGGQENGTLEFLAQSVDMEEHIQTIKAAILLTKKRKKSDKDMKISVDEWGVWSRPSDSVNEELDNMSWQVAPAISEQIYTLEDALLFSSMMMAMLKNVDVIKIACQSLLTNISACIMTEKNGGMWLQTIYYPFFYMANYAKGVVLKGVDNVPKYKTRKEKEVSYLDHVMIYNEKDKEIVLFAVNRHEREEIELDITVPEKKMKAVKKAITLTHNDKKATNQFNHENVLPIENDSVYIKKEKCYVSIPALSFNMILIEIE